MALSERDRRILRIGGAAAAALLAGFLLLNLLGGGSKEIGLPSFSPPVGQPESPSGSSTKTPIPTVSIGGRDPFSVPPGFSPTPTGGSPSPTGGSPSPTGGGHHGTSMNIGGFTVTLIDTFTLDGIEMVQVQVDGTVYDRAEGETFHGGDYEVDSISGDCATFLFGEEDFTLCTNPQK